MTWSPSASPDVISSIDTIGNADFDIPFFNLVFIRQYADEILVIPVR